MEHYAPPGSIARAIWGNSDTLLLVFAGAAAEFALNRAVDWLFFTGNLPRDPISRLFSTARFAQEIMFADAATAQRTAERIVKIHQAVERKRDATIPEWSHRDVLYMLMDYSERAYELLNRPLTPDERAELYAINRRFGIMLGIPELPVSYSAWQIDRQAHLERDMVVSDYTTILYAQYRHHLGPWRYKTLLDVQALLSPPLVRDMLKLKPNPATRPAINTYRQLTRWGLRPLIQRLVLPQEWLGDVRQLDQPLAAQPA